MPTFSDPAAGGDKLPLTELIGRLLLFDVQGIESDIVTAYGVTDAVKADVACLDGPQKGHRWEGTLVFPRVLRGQLAPRIGEMVLGRLGQGVAKPGQSAPWTLAAATDEDRATAGRYLEYAAAQSAAQEEPF